MTAARPLHPSADAKVARAFLETDDTYMENLPLHRLRAYFPHKPRPFQAHALFQASAEGMSDGRNNTKQDKGGSTESISALLPFLCTLTMERGITLAGISTNRHINRQTNRLAFCRQDDSTAATVPRCHSHDRESCRRVGCMAGCPRCGTPVASAD